MMRTAFNITNRTCFDIITCYVQQNIEFFKLNLHVIMNLSMKKNLLNDYIRY